MKSNPKLRREDLAYPDLSYKIMGVMFEVGNGLGFGHKENFYQKAVENEFRKNNIKCIGQLPVRMKFRGESVGIYYFDFLIEDKIVLEIKVRNYFSRKDIEQLYRYLKAKDLKLGLIVHFTNDGVKFKRVVNIS